MHQLLLFIIMPMLFIGNIQILLSQSLSVSGDVSDSGIRLKGVKVLIFRNGVLKLDQKTGKDGKFTFDLKEQGVFEIVFSKSGYTKQRFLIANLDYPEDSKDLSYGPWPVKMFPELSGSNTLMDQKPLAKIIYRKDLGKFSFDPDYHDNDAKEVLQAYQDSKKEAEEKEIIAKKKISVKEIKLQESYLIESAYNDLLRQAHILFQEQRYEAARTSYENALAMRPEEPFPKTKITDLNILIKTIENLGSLAETDTSKAIAVKEYREKIAEMQNKESDLPQVDNKEKILEDRRDSVTMPAFEKPKETQPKTAPEKILTTDNEEVSIEELQKILAESYKEGITEEIYHDGNRIIVRRIVVSQGKGNEYKKVIHPWGGIYYFKNGISITDRVWAQETGGY